VRQHTEGMVGTVI